MSNKRNDDKFLAATTCFDVVMGRHVVDEDGSIKFDWPGVRFVSSQISGTQSIKVRIQKVSGSVLGYSVTKQGRQEPIEQIVPTKFCLWSNQDCILANDLDSCKSYQVSIWKRDDPALCVVAGLVVDADAAVAPLEKATTPPRRMIEFVGDSDTVGYGIMGYKSGMMQHILLEAWRAPMSKRIKQATNVSKSWAVHVSKALDNSNYSIVAWSGIGAKYSPLGSFNMVDMYPRVLATDKKTTGKDLGTADAVIVYIGLNDQTALQGSWGSSDEKLSRGYEELLQVIRKHRPAPIPIIVVAPTLDCAVACAMNESERRKMCEMQNRLWKALVEKLGGPAAGYYFVENRHSPQIELNAAKDFGMCLHWNAASNKKWADGLFPSVSDIINNMSK